MQKVRKKQPVAQLVDNKPVAMFESRWAASKATGVDVAGIRKVCTDRRKTAGGYTWKNINITAQAKSHKNTGMIVQSDIQSGKVLGMYSSFPQASKVTGIRSSNIKSNVLNVRKSAGKFIWSLV